MITVKVSGPGAKIVADMIEKSLQDAGLTVSYWFDVVPKDREPQADARKKGATVLVLEMRSR